MAISSSARPGLQAGLLVGLLLALSVAAAAGDKPNFLILFVDDLGYNEINLEEMAPPSGGYRGYGNRTQTPHLAQLARDGMVFTSWYSAWHCCSASRASMLTGRLPPRTGVDSVGSGVFNADAIGGLPRNETTFAEVLSGAGYKTGMLGKWHLGQRQEFLPTARGFDYYFGIPFSVDMGISPWRPVEANAADSAPLPLLEGTKASGCHVIEQPVDLANLTARYVDKAAWFIATAGADPFVLYVAHSHVHNPQFCSPRWCGTSTVVGDGPAIPAGHGGTGSAVQEMDDSVGGILAALKAAGHADNTVVFFTSDNGAPPNHAAAQDQRGSNAPLKGFKGSISEGGIRMPAMVRWPGKVKPGSRTDSLAATYDIFSTMIAMAGAELPGERIIDGLDLRRIMLSGDGAGTTHRCLMQYHAGSDGPGAVRCGSYKLMFGSKPVLYDLDNDIGEASPLPMAQPPYAAIVANITAARAAHIASVVKVVDQIALGTSKEYTICGDPDSLKYHPSVPNCTLNNSVANWNPHWPPAPPAPPPLPPADFIGCYWDKGFPGHGSHDPCDLPVVKRGGCPGPDIDMSMAAMLTAQPHVQDPMTIELCAALCAGHRYMGVQNGGSGCFCGASFGRYGVSPNCTMHCDGNPGELCGGAGCNSIWLVPNATS